MLASFTPPNRRLTAALLVGGVGLATAAAIVGISDNPPGLLLAFLACIAIVSAFVHSWRTARQYTYLVFASGGAFVLLAVLHNVFEALAGHGAGAVARYALQPLGVVAFFLAIFACPAGVVVGAVGALVAFSRKRRHPPASAAP